MAIREYEVGLSPEEQAKAEPIGFVLYGHDVDNKPIRTSPFVCHQRMDAATLARWLEVMGGGQPSAGTEMIEAVRQCLRPEYVEAFDEAINGTAITVEITTIADVLKGLLEDYTQRPFELSQNSPDGHSPTGATSTAGSPSKATPRLPDLMHDASATSSTPWLSRTGVNS